jgi:hypothetical protein
MGLAEQVDPEEWHQIMGSVLPYPRRRIHRFEGTVN